MPFNPAAILKHVSDMDRSIIKAMTAIKPELDKAAEQLQVAASLHLKMITDKMDGIIVEALSQYLNRLPSKEDIYKSEIKYSQEPSDNRFLIYDNELVGTIEIKKNYYNGGYTTTVLFDPI